MHEWFIYSAGYLYSISGFSSSKCESYSPSIPAFVSLVDLLSYVENLPSCLACKEDTIFDFKGSLSIMACNLGSISVPISQDDRRPTPFPSPLFLLLVRYVFSSCSALNAPAPVCRVSLLTTSA
jgi:hypothetical protein